MKLRKKTLVITGLTIACLTVVVYAISSVILLRGFSRVEDQNVSHNVELSVDALDNEINTLGDLTRDWASWDDTYAFIEDNNEEYIESNLMLDTSFVNNRVNFMTFISSSGQVVYAKGFDLIKEETAAAPEGIQEYLPPDDAPIQEPDAKNGIRGVLLLPEGPVLIAAEPILTSERTGPSRGTLIWGRYLNSAEVERLSQLTHLSLAVFPLDDTGLPADFQTAKAVLSDDKPEFVQPFNEELIAGYTVIDDVAGKPALILRAEMPRPVYAQGQSALRYLVIAILAASLIFMVVTLLLLERLVLSRIFRLSREVVSISSSGDHSERVQMTGRDELSEFAQALNRMLDALEKSQAELRKAHYELEERVRERTSELRTLYDLSRLLVDANHSFDRIMGLVTRHAVEIIHITYAQLMLLEEEGKELVVRNAYPVRPLGHDLGIGRSIPVKAMPFSHKAMQQGEPVVIQQDSTEIAERELGELFYGFTHTLCLVPLSSDNKVVGLLALGEARSENREPFTPEKIRLARNIGDQATSALRGAELFVELESAYLQTVIALARTVDAKDTYTGDHGQRLAQMALAVGRETGMTEAELKDLRYGAILHDIGKIGVPDAVLQKPGKLDSREWEEMRQHPCIGAEIVSAVSHLKSAADIVRHHHERYDGDGYPGGLAGNDIPLGARILNVVDSYCTIIDKRVYKQARTHEEAVAELKRCSGSQFDPKIVEIFLGFYERAKVA